MVESSPVFVLGSFVAACSAKVARLPAAGESLLASNFVLEPGGKGFNLALGAQRLGQRVAGIFAIGNDPFADFAKSAFDRTGLDPGMLVQLDGPTGAGIGFIDAAGENCLAVAPGANAKLSAAHVMQAAGPVQNAKLLLAQFEIGDEPIACAFALARKAGAATLLNPSPYREIDKEILANTSILVVNRVEAGCLAAQYGLAEDPRALHGLAHLLFAEGVELLIVTLGADGAWIFERHAAPRHQPALAANVVDTLGAGDAFVAAFAAGFVAGIGLAECMRHAAAAGAFATTRLGVFEALPTRNQLEQILAGQQADEA